MNLIKEAFSKAKQDIQELRIQLADLSSQIFELKSLILQSDRQTNQQTDTSLNPTLQHINPTHNLNELFNMPQYALKSPISNVSIGNSGVPTDRQTNQQTDRHIILPKKIGLKAENNSSIDNLVRVSEVLDSLDEIKKELRKQFKHLTNQEMLVFSTIYQLEEEGFSVDYSLISKKLSLSESSIRDYVLKIIKKGISITKTKIDNKKIVLSISPALKSMASLKTILNLRAI